MFINPSNRTPCCFQGSGLRVAGQPLFSQSLNYVKAFPSLEGRTELGKTFRCLWEGPPLLVLEERWAQASQATVRWAPQGGCAPSTLAAAAPAPGPYLIFIFTGCSRCFPSGKPQMVTPGNPPGGKMSRQPGFSPLLFQGAGSVAGDVVGREGQVTKQGLGKTGRWGHSPAGQRVS